jgi:hypothetical protein
VRILKFHVLPLVLAASIAGSAAAQTMAPPTPEQAKQAVINLFGGQPDMRSAKLKLGTCVPTTAATQKGEVSCTFALVTAGGSSESQADFYPGPKGWSAEPTEEKNLPFPDPKLRS